MSMQYMGSSRRLLTNALSAVDMSDMLPPRTTQPSFHRDSCEHVVAGIAGTTAAARSRGPARKHKRGGAAHRHIPVTLHILSGGVPSCAGE